MQSTGDSRRTKPENELLIMKRDGRLEIMLQKLRKKKRSPSGIGPGRYHLRRLGPSLNRMASLQRSARENAFVATVG